MMIERGGGEAGGGEGGGETRVQPPLETGHWQRPIPWRLRVIALDLACTCTMHGVARRGFWRGGAVPTRGGG